MSARGATRRGFLAGAATLTLSRGSGWADAGAPHYLAAARTAAGAYHLVGLDAALAQVFSLPLPGRGHAAAAHPYRSLAVAFARRPGSFALVIDCAKRATIAKLTAPEGRHFYGHGVFSADGSRLYTTENDFGEGRGVIGVWDVGERVSRIGEFASNGVGPHDIQRLPGADVLVVANGGIDTHPDTGREKLNLPTMRSNISFLTERGRVEAMHELAPELRLNSIRHLAVADDGAVAFGCQWQGDAAYPAPLVGICRKGGAITLLAAPDWGDPALDGYIGSVALGADGAGLAATAPRGDRVLLFDMTRGGAPSVRKVMDVSGVAAAGAGFAYTSGVGRAGRLDDGGPARQSALAWDNHLIPIAGA